MAEKLTRAQREKIMRERNKPHMIDDDVTWFYETARGLHVVHEIRAEGLMGLTQRLRTDQFVIPWRKIEAAIRRRAALKEGET